MNTKKIHLDSVSIKVDEFASQGNAVLGIRDSGKSYTATWFAEQLFGAGVPFVAFDPVGIWRYLRVPGNGRGYPVVVAGGKDGDLPLTPKSAPEIVRAAMRENVSLVLDFFDIHLSKRDWKRIVEQSVRLLLYENTQYGLRHIFIEEAAEFAPQKIGPDQGTVYAEIEKLARMGGNSLLGYTLINQRAEEVNKAVLELCDCLFLHRQKGRNSLTALGKWLDFADAQSSKEVIKSLPRLPQGECWAWISGAEIPVRVRVPGKTSFHPNRRMLREHIDTAKAQAPVNVETFVQQMSTALEKHLEEAKENDPDELRARIRELEQQLEQGVEQVSPHFDERDMDEARRKGLVDGYRQAVQSFAQVADRILWAMRDLENAAKDLEQAAGSAQPPAADKWSEREIEEIKQVQPLVLNKIPPAPTRRPPDAAFFRLSTNGPKKLDKAHQAILGVLYNRNVKNGKQLALLAGYGYNGYFRKVLSELRTGSLIEGENTSAIQATDKGRTAAAEVIAPYMNKTALRAHWLGKSDKCGRKILQALLDYPNGLDKRALCEQTGYGYNGYFRKVLSELRTAGVLVGPNTGTMKAAPELL